MKMNVPFKPVAIYAMLAWELADLCGHWPPSPLVSSLIVLMQVLSVNQVCISSCFLITSKDKHLKWSKLLILLLKELNFHMLGKQNLWDNHPSLYMDATVTVVPRYYKCYLVMSSLKRSACHKELVAITKKEKGIAFVPCLFCSFLSFVNAIN